MDLGMGLFKRMAKLFRIWHRHYYISVQQKGCQNLKLGSLHASSAPPTRWTTLAKEPPSHLRVLRVRSVVVGRVARWAGRRGNGILAEIGRCWRLRLRRMIMTVLMMALIIQRSRCLIRILNPIRRGRVCLAMLMVKLITRFMKNLKKRISIPINCSSFSRCKG